MSFYVLLEKGSRIVRGDNDVPYSWRSGSTIAKFTEAIKFMNYVTENIADLQQAVAFTGSASLIVTCNTFITDELRKAGLLPSEINQRHHGGVAKP